MKVFWTDLVLGAQGKANSLQATADRERSLSKDSQNSPVPMEGVAWSLLGRQERCSRLIFISLRRTRCESSRLTNTPELILVCHSTRGLRRLLRHEGAEDWPINAPVSLYFPEYKALFPAFEHENVTQLKPPLGKQTLFLMMLYSQTGKKLTSWKGAGGFGLVLSSEVRRAAGRDVPRLLPPWFAWGRFGALSSAAPVLPLNSRRGSDRGGRGTGDRRAIAERRGEAAAHVAAVPHPPAAALGVPDSSHPDTGCGFRSENGGGGTPGFLGKQNLLLQHSQRFHPLGTLPRSSLSQERKEQWRAETAAVRLSKTHGAGTLNSRQGETMRKGVDFEQPRS